MESGVLKNTTTTQSLGFLPIIQGRSRPWARPNGEKKTVGAPAAKWYMYATHLCNNVGIRLIWRQFFVTYYYNGTIHATHLCMHRCVKSYYYYSTTSPSPTLLPLLYNSSYLYYSYSTTSLLLHPTICYSSTTTTTSFLQVIVYYYYSTTAPTNQLQILYSYY